jgi:hypothetical protein
VYRSMSNIQFKNAVQQWVNYDQQITKLNRMTKEYRDNKDIQEQSIINYIENNKLQNTTFKMNDCNISYKITQTQSPITLKLITETLHECIQNDDIIDNILQNINKKRHENGKVSKCIKKKKS